MSDKKSFIGKTVIVMTPTASGGLLKHSQMIIKLLLEQGARVIDFQGAVAESALGENPNLKTITAISHRHLRVLHELILLRKEIKSAKSSLIIHAQGFRQGAIAVLARSRALIGVRDIRLVITLHNQPNAGLAGVIAKMLWRICARGADVILAVSNDLLVESKHLGAKQVVAAVIPAGEIGESAPRSSNLYLDHNSGQAGRTMIFTLARLAPQKDLITLLSAIRIMKGKPEITPFELLIAGVGPEKKILEEYIVSNKLPVTLLGYIENPSEYLSKIDIYVQSSIWEGQPVALQEAIKAAKAIIATDVGGTAWVTKDSAYLIPARNPQLLAKAIEKFMDPKIRKIYEEKSLQRAKELPGQPELIAQLKEVYFNA